MPRAIFATLRAREGRRDDVLQALEPLFEQARGEAGTLLYVLHGSAREPDVLRFYELYTDGDAARAHSGNETLRSVFARLEDMLATPAEVVIADVIRSVGLDRVGEGGG